MRTMTARHVVVELTPEMRAAIDHLYETGLFGFTPAEVVQEALRAFVREQVKKGWLAWSMPKARSRRRGRTRRSS